LSPGLTSECNAFFDERARAGVITLVEREHPTPVEDLRAERTQLRSRRQSWRCRAQRSGFGVVRAKVPEVMQTRRDAQAQFGVLRLDGKAQCCLQIFVLAIEPIQPRDCHW
jgi:hypothetical protein